MREATLGKDSLNVAIALIAAGDSAEHAWIAAERISEKLNGRAYDHLATKADLREFARIIAEERNR